MEGYWGQSRRVLTAMRVGWGLEKERMREREKDGEDGEDGEDGAAVSPRRCVLTEDCGLRTRY